MNWSNQAFYRVKREAVFVALIASVLSLSACTPPAEQAQNYYRNGIALLEQGDLDKARLEFRNALQLASGMAEAVYGLALIAEKEGDWEQMYRLLLRVVEQDSKHYEANLKLGRILLAAGQLDGALGYSDTALALNPEDPGVLSLRAAILFKLDDVAGAMRYASAVLEKDPANVEALVVLASERMDAGATSEAIAYLDRGIAQNQNNITLQLIKVRALEAGEDVDGAEAILKQLIEAHPSSALRQMLAQFYLRHDEPGKAEAQLRTIAYEHPDQFQAKLDLIRFVNAVHGPEASLKETLALIEREPDNVELRFMLADLHRHHQDLDSMTATLRTIIKEWGEDPSGLKARGLLAGALLSQGEKAQAQALVREILAVDQRQEDGVILKARMALDERRLDQAIADLRVLLQDVPDSARALHLLGRAHELAGSVELAEGQYLRAFQASGMEPVYGLAYAEHLLKQGNSSRAERVMESVLRKDPGHLDALKMLAQIRVALRDWAGAQEVADRIDSLGDKSQVSNQIRGVALAGSREYDASIAAFRSAHEAAPERGQPLVGLVRTYIAANRIDEAITFLDSVRAASPDNVNAILLKGQLLQLKGDNAEAAEVFRAAVRVGSGNPLGYRNLAQLNYRLRQFEEAEAVIEDGLTVVPDDVGLRLAQATVFEATNRIEDAISVYERLVRDDPNADIAANNLAALLSEHRNDEKSLAKAYELARRFERSEIPQFTNTLGWAHHRVGRYNEAEYYLRDAVSKMPNMAIFRYHLGMNYLALQDKEAARRELEKAVELAPVSPFGQVEHAREQLASL